MLKGRFYDNGTFRVLRLALETELMGEDYILVHPDEYRRLAAEAGIKLPERAPLPASVARAIEKAFFGEAPE